MNTSKRLPDETIGALVRRRRHSLGMTVRTLAQRVGASETAVQSWESGSTNPSEKFCLPLARALALYHGELTKTTSPEYGSSYVSVHGYDWDTSHIEYHTNKFWDAENRSWLLIASGAIPQARMSTRSQSCGWLNIVRYQLEFTSEVEADAAKKAIALDASYLISQTSCINVWHMVKGEWKNQDVYKQPRDNEWRCSVSLEECLDQMNAWMTACAQFSRVETFLATTRRPLKERSRN